MPRILSVYIDESGTPGLADTDNFILGAFLSEKAIDPSLIQPAINNLKNDPDATDVDRVTLSRGFFHASLDSKNAHSHLCRQISSINWPCEFFIDVINKQSVLQTDRRDIADEAKMHHHLLSIVGVHFTKGHFDTVRFYIAERQGSFESHDKDKWADGFIEAMAYSSIQTPNIPICLPELDIVISNGSDPGIQVCDFLVWAVQRDVFRGDSTWVKRSRLFMHSAYRIETNPLSGNEYYLNNMIHDDLLVSIEQIPEPSALEQHWNQNGISIGMVNIELQLRALGAQNHLVKNSRLRNRLLSLIPKLKEVKLHNDSIIEMAKLYLLLADQAPLYDIKKPDEIILAYHYKKICSKTADLQNLDSFRFCQHWRLVREWMNQNDKEVLFKE